MENRFNINIKFLFSFTLYSYNRVGRGIKSRDSHSIFNFLLKFAKFNASLIGDQKKINYPKWGLDPNKCFYSQHYFTV